MIIPETRWTHPVVVGFGLGGMSVVILDDLKYRAILLIRWPWSMPIEFEDADGRKTSTRFLLRDHRESPLSLSQIAINGKTATELTGE